jgi:hypothetical protein
MKHRCARIRCLCRFFVRAVALTVLVIFVAEPVSLAGETPLRCDIQNTFCTMKTPDGMTIEFDVQPKPVTSMTESTFVVIVTRNGQPLTDASILLDLSMPHMFMGRNQPALRQVKDGRYEGKGIIARCASGRKTWQADVTVKTSGKTALASFVFEVH